MKIDIDIPLKQWTCNQFLVTSGYVLNNVCYENYLTHKSTEQKGEPPRPYFVKFLTNAQYDELMEEYQNKQKDNLDNKTIMSDIFGAKHD